MLAEVDAHACGLPSHVVMTLTADLATAVEAAVERGAVWSPETGAAELIRRHGVERAQHIADQARIMTGVADRHRRRGHSSG